MPTFSSGECTSSAANSNRSNCPRFRSKAICPFDDLSKLSCDATRSPAFHPSFKPSLLTFRTFYSSPFSSFSWLDQDGGLEIFELQYFGIDVVFGFSIFDSSCWYSYSFSCSVFFCTVIILYSNTGLGIIQFIVLPQSRRIPCKLTLSANVTTGYTISWL